MKQLLFEHTTAESSTLGTLLYIVNHLSDKIRSDLNISKTMNWNPLFLK